MQTVETPLDQHLEQIIQAILDRLEAARQAGGALSDVLHIVRGDRVRTSKVRPPSLWVFPSPDNIESAGGTTNVHKIEYIIVALVSNTDPEEGQKAANNLAARAYTVLLEDRLLGNTVHDFKPARFDQSYGDQLSENTFAAAAVFNAIVRRRE
ncbi:MAG: hypothetical protein HPY55_06555 [Firmicutes bacterium]|nr:hypothetical protein [Bacillota bacterium]